MQISSQQDEIYILTQISESLAGRVATLEVGTFKMNERYALPLSEFYSRMNVDAVEGSTMDALLDLPVEEYSQPGKNQKQVIGQDALGLFA